MKLEVFDKYTRLRVNLIRSYDYVTYEDEFSDQGSFEINVPTNEKSLVDIKEGNYIWFENDTVGIIKGIKSIQGDDSKVSIYGYLTNHFLTYRSFLLTANYYDKLNLILRKMFDDLFLNPQDSDREIDFFKLSQDPKYNPDITGKIRVQNTGDTYLDFANEICDPYDMGVFLCPNFNIDLVSQNGNISDFELRVIKPVNRTIGNPQNNVPVVFSFDFNNLTTLEFEEDYRTYCSMSFVAGEGSGSDRKHVETGDLLKTGIDRIELYVDARDLQSDIEGEEMTDEEYTEALIQRGNEKLSERQKLVSFDATVLEGKYKYRRDFFLGDFVSVVDKSSGKTYGLQIRKVKRTYSKGNEHFDITFGKDRLWIQNLKERRVMSNV